MQPEDTSPRLLLYGANGYTGRLILEEACRLQLPLIVGGRREQAIEPLAARHQCEARVFTLDDVHHVADQLADVRLVLNCAGPFSYTAETMVQACLDAGAHYLDVTGEIDVIERIASLHERALQRQVTLMPAVGFDVVPSDCLAARLAAALPSATHLQLAFATPLAVSPGTAKTVLQRSADGGRVRQNGQIVRIPTAWKQKEIDFPAGTRSAVTIPWGDVATAFYTTAIPNIEVYTALSPTQIRRMRRLRWLQSVARWTAVQWIGEKVIEHLVQGPSEGQRRATTAEFWGHVYDAQDRSATATLTTPDGYSLTVQTALEIVQRVLAGQVEPGFQTPGKVFGGGFLDQLVGLSFQWVQPSG